jgi:hypothetical protein
LLNTAVRLFTDRVLRLMKKPRILLLIIMFLTIVSAAPCFASWLIYHKPEFRGKVIDAETKEPIGGAVAVAIYFKYPIISGPGGGSASIIHIKETLTDEKGEFYIPSYTAMIQPNSVEDDTRFIIYKPGYGKFPHQRTSPPKPMSSPAIEKFFLKDSFGKEGEIVLDFEPFKKAYGTYRVVELPRLKTKKDRLRAIPSPPSDFKKDCPLLYEAINAEYKRFRIEPFGR